MDHDKKLAFIHKMAKMGIDHIEHMDFGGGIGGIAGGLTGASLAGVPGAIVGAGLGSNLGSQIMPNNPLVNSYSPNTIPINPGATPGQLNTAYAGVQGGLNEQQGIANNLAPGVYQGSASQNMLSGQLVNQAQGLGPNPAQAALNESTGRNIEQQAALMAGQRGAGANAGALAEGAARQGGAIQQNAIGQSATLQAQQQLAAEQQLQNLSAQQVAQGANAVQGVNQQQQNEQNILQGANSASNNALVGMQSNINNTNAQVASGNQAAAGQLFGGLLSGASAGLSSGLFKAQGGLVKMDMGGNVLDASARQHISEHNFALPGRRYPIHDEAHARNALARVSQHGTPAEKKTVKAAVHRKYPGMGVKKMADGGEAKKSLYSTSGYDEYKKTSPTSNVVNKVSPIWSDDPPTKLSPPPGYQVTPRSAYENDACGGMVGYKNMADGGFTAPMPLQVQPTGSESMASQWINSNVSNPGMPSVGSMQQNPEMADLSKPASSLGTAYANSRKKGVEEPPPQIGTGAKYGSSPMLNDFDGGLAAKGGNVKASSKEEKAEVDGNSLKNDKIPAMLSEGEVVMDKETLADQGPVGEMARAVASHIAKRNKRR